jgi:ferredoxin
MLVIDPDVCIDCGVCEAECPADAIIQDTVPGAEQWIELNRKYAALWPNITKKGPVPIDADAWLNVPNKYKDHFKE